MSEEMSVFFVRKRNESDYFKENFCCWQASSRWPLKSYCVGRRGNKLTTKTIKLWACRKDTNCYYRFLSRRPRWKSSLELPPAFCWLCLFYALYYFLQEVRWLWKDSKHLLLRQVRLLPGAFFSIGFNVHGSWNEMDICLGVVVF